MPKILITGTAGFIGFHLANALLAKGHTILGLDNINDYYDVQLKYDRLSQAGIHLNRAGTPTDPGTSHQPSARSADQPEWRSHDQPTTNNRRGHSPRQTNNPTAPSDAHGLPPQPPSHENQQPEGAQPPPTGGASAPTNQQPSEEASASTYRFVRGDLTNRDLINDLFATEKFDYVVHLAAQAGVRYSLTNPQAYMDANITGTLNILEACRTHPVKHLVYASSSSVYGKNTAMPFSVNHNVDHPVSLYAASKKSNELMAHTYSHLFGIPATGLRFFTVYGPWGRPDMALFLFTKAILENKPIQVFNRGEMMRDFTYVDDIVEGITRVMENPATANPRWNSQSPDPATSNVSHRVYNIGRGKPVKLMDFIAALEQALGTTAEKELMPMQPGDVPATWADTTALEQDVGYTPRTPVETGIREFVTWYKNYYKG